MNRAIGHHGKDPSHCLASPHYLMSMKPSSAQSSTTERALAAIVLTDAVSFSARMSVDEEGTLMLIQRDLELIAEQCECFGGKVLKSTGDGLLMSFYSAVQAVLCSQEVQKQLAKLAESSATGESLQHRIGVHLGDVLFRHQDVLGNGVNIAARLQAKSAPGGVCISQTVYDVVKARIDINATFLGPLKLKNIQEPVAAFQIPPFGQSATMVVPQLAGQPVVADLSPLAIAAATLEQAPQIRRIKKLIFGTYQGVWENDAKVLMQFDLLPLLKQLYQRHRTLISLEKALQTMAARLNHKSAYLAVADTILQALEPVYTEAEDSASDGEVASRSSLRDRYNEIAETLAQQTDRLRIKKLLYAVIHTAWENDQAVLALHTLADLVTDVHQIAPSEADLSYHLERIIKRLNRHNHYAQLALIISEAFHPLYGAPVEAAPMVTELSAEPLADGHTMMFGSDKPVIDEGLTSLTGWQSSVLSDGQTSVHSSQLAIANVCPIEGPQDAKIHDRANLYALRLEIMRYTNPLRAKILLLSTVRSPFTATPQDWLTLKSKSLDDLIKTTFQYCQTFSDLESKLTIMSHCVGNVGENIQAAGAILQAMKPFYP